MRSGRPSNEEVKAHHQELAMRYRKAFAKCKVNWLKVKFDPITPIYVEQKAEQKYLADYGFNLCQKWRPNHHLISNDNSEPERQKIIEQERLKKEKLGVETPFGFFPFAKKPVKSHKPRTTNRNPTRRKTIYLD
tara:strand:+ start:426 stop:827 length:402 start_codon:yes stop_codon:yes gene_type:complete